MPENDGQGMSVPCAVSLVLTPAERRALRKARDAGWRALTAREVLLCQQVLVLLADALDIVPD
jgi:hypothetical protein